ncbi:MAG: hypothetical protein M3O31_14675 [Acidobacteriota bacterium]|nr:hypothetical protein [Acidobacteriota bacterium]
MKWPRLSILVLLSAMAVAPGLAQAPVAAAVPAFDVISVKPDKAVEVLVIDHIEKPAGD